MLTTILDFVLKDLKLVSMIIIQNTKNLIIKSLNMNFKHIPMLMVSNKSIICR